MQQVKRIAYFFIIMFALMSCSTTQIFIVRHAEKSSLPANDPLLTTEGEQRALDLKDRLKNENIKNIFSTKTTRTMSTARPLSELQHVPIQNYDPREPMEKFRAKIFDIKEGNTLIVGHSNTIGKIANGLAGKSVVSEEIDEKIYDLLYILKWKKSGKGEVKFIVEKYGKSTLADLTK